MTDFERASTVDSPSDEFVRLFDDLSQDIHELTLQRHELSSELDKLRVKYSELCIDSESRYSEMQAKLDEASSLNALLKSELEVMQQKDREFREEAELTLLQLHQAQEELESMFTTLQQSQQASNDSRAALSSRDLQISQLKSELEVMQKKDRESREEAELTLLQLHQVREELEHYFLQARGLEGILVAQKDQLRRSESLMVRLLPEAAQTQMASEAVPIEVLPQESAPNIVQTQALLDSYAAALKRAYVLLQRFIPHR